MTEELDIIGDMIYSANLLNIAQNGDKLLRHMVNIVTKMRLVGEKRVPGPNDFKFMGFGIEDLVAWIPDLQFYDLLKYVQEKKMEGNLFALILREYLWSESKTRVQRVLLMERWMTE